MHPTFSDSKMDLPVRKNTDTNLNIDQQAKKERNRKSARDCRKRRKDYITKLENEVIYIRNNIQKGGLLDFTACRS